jgi:hypothetical protein
MSHLRSMYRLKFLDYVVERISTEEDIKAISVEVGEAIESFKVLAGRIKTACNDIETTITRSLARKEKDLDRQHSNLAKAAVKEKRKLETERVASKKRAAKGGEPLIAAQPSVAEGTPSKNPTPSALLCRVSSKHPIKEFATMDAMRASVKDASFDCLCGEPFVDRENSLLTELCEERGPKASIGIYNIQLPSSAKQTGRGQTPFASDRKIRAGELLLDVVPRKQAMSTEYPWAFRLVQTCSTCQK